MKRLVFAGAIVTPSFLLVDDETGTAEQISVDPVHVRASDWGHWTTESWPKMVEDLRDRAEAAHNLAIGELSN